MKEDYRFAKTSFPAIQPVGFGRQNCPPGFSVSVPRPYYMIHYIFSGGGSLVTGGRTYRLHPSQMFIIRPHQAHTYTADTQNPWRYAWIVFYADGPLPQIEDTDVVTSPACARIFESLSEIPAFACGREEILTGKIWELLGVLKRQEEKSRSTVNPYIAKAKRYIADRFPAPVKVAEIAGHIGLDRSYFSSLFRKETGLSPQEFLTGYRLERAAQMLADEDASVSAAAERAGYGDVVNFSRMFKKHFGISPSKYRDAVLAREANQEKESYPS